MDLFANRPARAGRGLWRCCCQPQQLMYLVGGVLLGLWVGILPGLGGIAGLSLRAALHLRHGPGLRPRADGRPARHRSRRPTPSPRCCSASRARLGAGHGARRVSAGPAGAGRRARCRPPSPARSTAASSAPLVLTFFIIIARPLILAFGLPEMLMLTILGLSMVAILAGRRAAQGHHRRGPRPSRRHHRRGGRRRQRCACRPTTCPTSSTACSSIIVGLGIYAHPRDRRRCCGRTSRSPKSAKLGKGWIEGVRDWWRQHLALDAVRGHRRRRRHHPGPRRLGRGLDRLRPRRADDQGPLAFGKGEIRGVIGPESSANAKEGGAWSRR